MAMQWQNWLASAAIAGAGMLSLGATVAIAQQADDSIPTSLPEAFEEAFFDDDKRYFENRSYGRQLDLILFSFPENEINNDGESVHILYLDALQQQVATDPIIRTPDLPNPYDSSLLTLPPAISGSSVRGSEFIFDSTPLR